MIGFSILRQKIIDKINAAILAGTITHIGEAYWSPSKIMKMPAVVVMPEALESTYQNTAGGRHRVFVFRPYVIKGVEGEKQEDVEKLLSSACDELIELFDRKDALTVEGLIHIEPTPSVWGWLNYGGGEARMATITLRCDVIVSTT